VGEIDREDAEMIEQTQERFPELTFVGVDGVLLRFGADVTEQANVAAFSFHQHIDSLGLQSILESAPSLSAVFLRLDLAGDLDATVQLIEAEMRAKDWLGLAFRPDRQWTIPCSFDGPQLSEAAGLAGVSEADAIAQITDVRLRVLTLGFAPGQPYLGSLEPHWNIPRMDGIAPKVPAGALVVAVRQLIIFSFEAPTGWRHIGQTAFRCFDKDRTTPFAFEAGDVVRFARASTGEIEDLRQDTFGGARLETLT
jgi:KipI family sensor histidine kinase inhibitor